MKHTTTADHLANKKEISQNSIHPTPIYKEMCLGTMFLSDTTFCCDLRLGSLDVYIKETATINPKSIPQVTKLFNLQ
jgi:hypothetical protein